MDKRNNKYWYIFQVALLIILILLAIKMAWNREDKDNHIESCKPIGCINVKHWKLGDYFLTQNNNRG
jgi:type IV secretory pathway VirB10-like protein